MINRKNGKFPSFTTARLQALPTGIVGRATHLVLLRAQYAIADYLQNGPKRLQVQAFRGVGKSWITGAFVLWTLFNDPERKVMIISASKERADNMSIFLQKLIIDTPWLKPPPT